MRVFTLCFVLLFLVSCQKKSNQTNSDLLTPWMKENPDILQPNSFAMDSSPVLIKGARIMTAAGDIHEQGSLLMKGGFIQKVSATTIDSIPEGTQVIDGAGLTVTPGIIDVHSHMGVYPSPSIDAHYDGNEHVRPVTADVWAEHAFWPQDPDIWRALAGGVTTIQVLPGSANLFGGRTFTAKLLPKISAREMRFPEAPQGLKMACGENPKRVYKDKEIKTRMGNVARYRKEFQKALEYLRSWENCPKCKDGKLPMRDFVYETLAKVLKGEIFIHFHCYRADDISAVLDLAKEFGFKIRTIHHGLEAYKLASRLAEEDVSVATWSDWWGFKAEAFDGIPYNVALLERAGAKAIVHSDSAVDIRFLNLEAGKALKAAKKLGLDFSDDQALKWITKNAAWALGLEDKIGTLEAGKMADIVLWDGHPFSALTKAQMVFINGKPVFDRKEKKRIRSDFELGYNDMEFYDGRGFNSVLPPKNMTWPQPSSFSDKKIEGDFKIINVRLFVDGKWRENYSVGIKKGKVVEFGSALKGQYENQLDGQGQSLTPGLIDSSSSLGLFDISLDSQAQDTRANTLNPTPHLRAENALNLQNIRLPISRNEGITTSISALSGGIAGSFGVAFDTLESNSLLDTQVALLGNLERRGKDENRATIWANLEILIDEAHTYSKRKSAFLNGQTNSFKFKKYQLEAMQPIVTGKKPWVMHVNRQDDLSRLIRLKKKLSKNGVNINFVFLGAAESWLIIEELKAANIPVLISPTSQTPQSFNQTRARFDLAAFLQSHSVPFAIVDFSGNGGSRLRQEAAMAVKYGLTPEKALLAITKTPGKVFGLDRGEIKPGAVANLVLWSGSPLEPTSEAVKIWVQGKDMTGQDRQLQLARKYLK